MKKLFALALVVFGLAACQTDPNELDVNVGGEILTTVNISIPETTRSNSAEGAFVNVNLDGDATIRYILQVYYNGEPSDERLVKYSDGKSVAFDVRLVSGRKYQFVAWADYVDGEADVDKHYDTSDLENITLNGEWNAMDETRDAFTATEEFTYSSTASINLTLTRPFAKLRIITTDMKALNNIDIEPHNAVVTYMTQFHESFNAFNGQYGAETVSKTHTFTIKDYDDNKANESKVLFTDYFFADDSDVVKFVMNVNEANGALIKSNTFNTDINVKRNFLTTISGNILTDGNNVNVKVEDAFDVPENTEKIWDGKTIIEPVLKNNCYEIYDPAELAYIAQLVNGTLDTDNVTTRTAVAADNLAGKTIKLMNDIDLYNNAWTPIGNANNIFKGTFEGQGHTIYNLVVRGGSSSNQGLFGVTHDGEIKNLVIENAKVAGGLNVGVVAGQPYTTKYTNITVQGHVEVNGMAYVGGVGGKNAYADWTNITIDVDETSYVKANSVEGDTAYRTYVGGVVGFNGEGSHKFSNIKSNINVEGSTCDVGGLFGIAHYGNQFEYCYCYGNVTNTTDEVENAFEMGGIAGVWHNENGTTVKLTVCEFTGTLLTPNITEEVDFYYGGLIGKPYSATGTGKLIISGTQYVRSLAELQAAVDAADEDVTICFGADIEGDVTVIQKQGVKITIDGENQKYTGSIKVHSNSNHYADAALTIKDVNFETSTAKVNFIEALENGAKRYSCNITVENCTFTATGDAVNTAVGVQIKASKNAKVLNCTATDMHSLIQAQSCDESVLVQNCTVNGKNGVAFKQVKAATVEGTTIVATEYGIRFDGNIDNYGITVKNNDVTAKQPFIVRKMTGKDNTITLEGTNTLTPTTGETYQIVITNGSDDVTYVVPTGTYTLTGADNFVVYPPIEDYDAFLEKISDDTWYDDTKTELAVEDIADFAAFVETANSGNDFEGKTIKLTGDIDLYFEDITAMADGDPITFRPIGDTKYNGGKPFKGTFDGQGHTIMNLYQNGWDLGYEWGVYGSYGLFGSLDGATVKNVVIEGSESYIEGGDVSFIAGSATGNCVFENITINSGVAATYNNGCGGIIGWSGAGTYTFKNITIGKDAVLGGLWGSFDSSIGGIVGQAEPGATYNFENVTINCRIDAYNDCTASYDYYNYRMCGMIIGRCEETTTIDGKNYPDLTKYNLTFNNVVVNYGDWMNYHYCRRSGERAVRIEPGYAYGGAENRDHSNDDKHCMECIPFNQLIGGDQYAVKGLPTVDGVTVNYPESFYREQGK